MQRMWVALALTGSPIGDDSGVWPPAFATNAATTSGGAAGPLRELKLAKGGGGGGAPFDVESGRDAEFCEFWAEDSPYA